MLAHSLKFILNIISPRTCAGCKREKEVFCEKCADETFKYGGSCIFCNQRNGTSRICFLCKKTYEPAFEKALWVGEYKNALKNAIWELKYKQRHELAKPLGELLFKKFSEFYPKFKKEDFLAIPIPMHPKKQQKRKYNQAELLAQEFGKLSGIEVENNLLFKKQDTKTQVETKTKEERIKNLSEAFRVKGQGSSINNKTIILIDDVATTGATFVHASQAIQKTSPLGGEVKIICLAVAHGYG